MKENKYTVYKGLQKPLELFGLKGRFIIYGVVGVSTAIFTFILLYILFSSFLFGLLTSIITLSITVIYSYRESKKGLYRKKEKKAIIIVNRLIK